MGLFSLCSWIGWLFGRLFLHYFDKTNNYFKKVKEKETRCLVSSIRNLPNYSTNNTNTTTTMFLLYLLEQ